MKTVFAAVLLSILASNTFAVEEHRLRAEVAYGQGRFERSPPGMWWQPDHDNPSQYKDNQSWEAGLSYSLTPIFGVSARLVHIGWAHTRARATTCPLDDCANRDRSLDSRRQDCPLAFSDNNCMYEWDGDGGINHGINLALTAELLKVWRLSFEAEGGVLLYRVNWSEQVHNIGCSGTECPWRMDVDQRSDFFLSPMVGATLRADRCFGLLPAGWGCSAGTRYYFRTTQHTPVTAGIAGPAQTWLIGMQKTF